ncbi:MAG TPA: DNA translocase FtsK [Bacteroidales bacterium]|nr:DNA translocase FtsK [Bacteroidales bacterium]
MNKEKRKSNGKSRRIKPTPRGQQGTSNLNSERLKFITGLAITGFAVYLLFAFIAYLVWWKADQSFDTSQVLTGTEIEVRNWSGKSGAWFAEMLINRGFGLAAFFLPVLFAATGLKLLNLRKIKLLPIARNMILGTIIISVILGYIFGHADGVLGSGPGGAHGYFVSRWLNAFMGKLGTGILLLVILISYLMIAFKLTPAFFSIILSSLRPGKRENTGLSAEDSSTDFTLSMMDSDTGSADPSAHSDILSSEEYKDFNIVKNLDEDRERNRDTHVSSDTGDSIIKNLDDSRKESSTGDGKEVTISITRAEAGDLLTDEELKRIQEEYDPKLDLSRFQMPHVSLLEEYKSTGSLDDKEIIQNKETIVKTLSDYNISTQHISATIGPTVTLYEVVPERGVRLAKIKSLDNDIALSLSAFGIRIIAPIPGRGTVGIEVPNSKPETVSMRSLISSKAYQESNYELPIALGRTITNEPLLMDLSKMPHLLVAGATGQGKSVGLNVIITSLLYKKHPAELKFVMVDPKMVELTMYSRIERHYLAKLPDADDAIITDTQKVVYTLNSLCIEMENRYELFRKAEVRNIKEYNDKFTARKLSPESGHRFLPYIVLIIDEFADLIMTAGKEIEGPIQRLAQLARAIGIHLIIATQRPSTNIITGIIKTNFPARLAFRVSSSIDSRTILDQMGAEKLVGRGDMLYYNGNNMIRAQCAFIDAPEINRITEFIGSQQGYSDALILPEYEGDTDYGIQEVDLKKRDSKFDEAAKLVVQFQQGSTSLIQRKLSLGYNRAGRIVDQLEAAGILGPFEGSKAREVLITDMNRLQQILRSLE